jgi:RNA polymerase sigma-70 factor (ECF subfamily)
MDDLFGRVVAAQSGDAEALEGILRQIRPVFRAFFIKRIGERPEVDDLIQNSLLRIHRGLKDLKDPAKLRGFAMKAALYELNDYYRGRYSVREVLVNTLPDRIGPPTEARLITAMDIDAALAEISSKARNIIELREVGYRYEEIADMIGSTEAAVKMQVKRAFEKLREILLHVTID